MVCSPVRLLVASAPSCGQVMLRGKVVVSEERVLLHLVRSYTEQQLHYDACPPGRRHHLDGRHCHEVHDHGDGHPNPPPPPSDVANGG